MDKGIATICAPIDEQRSGRGCRVTWRNTGGASPLFTDLEFSSLAEYKAIVRHQMFSAMLSDGAVLQISYDFEGHKIVGHRLVFYPCPFVIPLELRADPVLDVIEFLESVAPDSLRLRGPLRFDYSQTEGEGRAASHVHLSASDCRCPVVAPLMLGQFLRFVFRSFYPSLWSHNEYLRDLPRGLGSSTIVKADTPDLHFACVR